MKAVEEKFLKFLQTEAQFKIPIYQRLYSWTDEHCQTLIDDITMLLENPAFPIHFMGSIVYIDEKGQATLSSTRELLVIDGQQRLTTFTLIFIFLESLVRNGNKELNIQPDPSFADKIREGCLINKYSKLQNKNKIILTRSDNDTIQQLLNYGRDTITNSDSQIILNYDFIAGQIRELLKRFTIDQFYDNLNKLMIVDVALFHNIDNPQQTFESLNATGKELEDGDLIRNFLLMNLSNEKQIEIYDKFWYPMESSLKENLTHFISNFLYMEKGVSTNIKNLYKEFKIYFYNNYSRERIEQIAERLFIFSRYYSLLIGAADIVDEDSRLQAVITSLRRLGYDSHIPLLLPIIHEYKVGHVLQNTVQTTNSADHKRLSLNELIDIIKSIESYLIRRIISEMPTNTLNSVFRTLWSNVDKDDIKFSFFEKFTELDWRRKFPDDITFKDSLINNALYGKDIAKLILIELEKFDNKEANSSYDDLQIEHVLPKTDDDPEKLSEKWRQMLGENWLDIRNTWVHKLGNLTLTGYNPEYSDYDFETKKTMENGFLQSSLRLNQEIAKNSIWNEDTIKARAESLAERVLKIWKYPIKKKLIFRWESESYHTEVFKMTEDGNEKFVNRYTSKDLDENINELEHQGESTYRSFEDFWGEFINKKNWLYSQPMLVQKEYILFIQKFLNNLDQETLTEEEIQKATLWLNGILNEE